MTHQTHFTSLEEFTDVLSQQGWGAIPELLRILVNQAMVEERAKFLQAKAYERSAHPSGHQTTGHPRPGFLPSNRPSAHLHLANHLFGGIIRPGRIRLKPIPMALRFREPHR